MPMPTEDHAPTGALNTTLMTGSVDRALSATTRPAAGTGARGPSAGTIARYWEAWKRVEDWRRSRRVDLPDGRVVAPQIMPMSSETLAEYVAHLASQGLSRSSLERARAAIRWRHREEGHPVPDGVPSLGVLRDHETSREEAGQSERHAVAMPLADLVRLIEGSCDLGIPQGKRDAAIFLVAFAAKLGVGDLHDLNVSDVRLERGDEGAGEIWVRVPSRDRWVPVPHWSDHTGRHARLCPVEAVWQWLLWLHGVQAAPASPLFRPIDRADRAAGVNTVRMGRTPPEGRLTKGGFWKVLRFALARAGMDGLGYDMRSLRKGGAVEDRKAGVGQAAIAQQGGWKTTTGSFQDAMLTAETQSGASGRTGAHRLPPPAPVQSTLFDLEP